MGWSRGGWRVANPHRKSKKSKAAATIHGQFFNVRTPKNSSGPWTSRGFEIPYQFMSVLGKGSERDVKTIEYHNRSPRMPRTARISVVSNMSKLSASSFFMQENMSTGRENKGDICDQSARRYQLNKKHMWFPDVSMCGTFLVWFEWQAFSGISCGTRNQAMRHTCSQICGTTS